MLGPTCLVVDHKLCDPRPRLLPLAAEFMLLHTRSPRARLKRRASQTRVPAPDTEPPNEVALRHIGTRAQAPEVVVRPSAEDVPTNQSEVEARRRVPAGRAGFETSRLEVGPRAQLEEPGPHLGLGAEAPRIHHFFAGTVDL